MVHIEEVRLPNWRRFTDLTLAEIPKETRLVVLAGPNGLGKSSIFDGFRAWQGQYLGINWDELYYQKSGAPNPASPSSIILKFHETHAHDPAFVRAAFTFRTAFRMEADFSASVISQMPALMEAPRINRMSDIDAAVSQNYHRILSSAVSHLFNRDERERTLGQVQDSMLAATTKAMKTIFGDLEVENIGDPLEGGAFYFSKGASRNWHYKNLSGGERAAFDLILDIAVKATAFTDAVYCIDEPEVHLNTAVQGLLLREILELLPQNSQMWIATHSIGMLREARARAHSHGDVTFFDLEGQDMDRELVLTPVQPTRQFWTGALRVALADLADLVAPATVVLVEGRPRWEGYAKGNAEFDARCLRNIFGRSFPDTEFISVGSAEDVEVDRLHLGSTTSLLSPGTRVIRLVDQDDRSPEQVAQLKAEGVRVLGLRDLENYLLSDEVLSKFCLDRAPAGTDGAEIAQEAIRKKNHLLAQAVESGKPADDVKYISGPLYVWLKRRLELRQVGNTAPDFLRDTMSRYLTEDTETYRTLSSSIFGESK
ncbi:AAA family ATPase [Cellulomonas iranensis]|uniref:AAA family ATPase n=1 Tax=Cellulomonas iranensis TaxID=76862 RepID=UPI003D7CFB8D